VAKISSVNVLAGDGVGSYLFNIQQTLVAAGWTIQKSSDGTTYKSTPGSQITASGAGAGGANNNNAWFLAQDPGGRRQFIVQRGTATTQMRAAYSALAKFTGGAPSATVLPTATDGQFVIGTSGAFATIPASGTYYVHCIAQSTPLGNVYGFWILATAVGTGATITGGLLCCEPMATGSFPVADVDPVVILARDGANYFTSYWWKYGFGDQAYVNMGSGVYVGSFFISGTGLNGIGGSGTYAGDNPYDGLVNNIPAFFGRPSSLTQAGWKGWSTGMLTKLSNHAYPDTADLATDAFVFMDIAMMLPWPNTVVPLV
jgi:hypothetical protein